MTYTAAVVLAVVLVVLIDGVVLRTRLVAKTSFWATYAIIVGFQLISNGVLTGRGVVRYDPAAIVGPRLAHAPVEDLGFGFALVLLSLALWVWWGRRGVQVVTLAPRPRWSLPPRTWRFSRLGGWRRPRDR